MSDVPKPDVWMSLSYTRKGKVYEVRSEYHKKTASFFYNFY